MVKKFLYKNLYHQRYKKPEMVSYAVNIIQVVFHCSQFALALTQNI